MVYDTETKEAKHVALTNTPQFIELTMEEFNGTWSGSDPSVGDYIRVISDKPWTEDKIEESRLFLKARSLEVVCSRVQVDEAFEVRLDVEPGASYDEMVTEYVKSGLVDLDGLEEEWLVAVGHKILSEVSS